MSRGHNRLVFKWFCNFSQHIRNIKYVKDFPKFVSENGNKPLQAIVEQVRNDRGNYMILDVIILPNFYSIPFALSGLNVSIGN